MGRPKAKLTLTETEQSTLEQMRRRGSIGAAMKQRARIVLLCSEGRDSVDVAEELGVTAQTVCKWRKRFLDRRLNLDVHLVMDNYATHKTDAVKRWLMRRPRYHLHFTPTSSSWLNLVESFFSMVARNVTQRGVHRSVAALESSVRDFLETHNQDPKPFVWTKSADDILENLRRYCEDASATRARKVLRQMSRTSQSPH